MVTIETVGYEQWAPGGSGKLKAMIIGANGVGKTRGASYWPRPLYADVEKGLASVADRGVQRAAIDSTKDMLDLLAHLAKQAKMKRLHHETLVIDTLDRFQRMAMDEWMRQENTDEFSGNAAWAYNDAQMMMLLNRALALPMHVLFLVHPVDRVDRAASTKEDTVVNTVLRMRGSIKDDIFDDFDLVGLMKVRHVPDGEGNRKEQREISFRHTPKYPFLKDRLYIQGEQRAFPINFDEEDFTQLLEPFLERMDDFDASEVVEEVPHYDPDAPSDEGVVEPEKVKGPVPAQEQQTLPLSKLKVLELRDIATDLGLSYQGLKKAELVDAIEAERAKRAASEAVPPEAEAPKEVISKDQVEEATKKAVANVGSENDSENDESDDEPEQEPEQPEQEPEPEDESGHVTPPEDSTACTDCGKPLEGENPNYVRLSYIKFRRYLCQEHWNQAKAAAA